MRALGAGRMTMGLRAGALAAALIAGVAGAAAAAEDDSFLPDGAFVKRLKADAPLMARLATCPADLARDKAPVAQAATPPTAFCETHPSVCLDACDRGDDPNRCFALALDLQNDANFKLEAEAAYAAACAAGLMLGCTNRGAGIEGARVEGDPFKAQPMTAHAACLVRTFTATCEHDDAWGCAMLGMAYQRGVGLAADVAKARSLYERSCAIRQHFDACDASRKLLTTLPSR